MLIRENTNPTIIGCIVSEELVNDPQIISVARGCNGELTVEWVGGGVLQSSTDLKSWQAVEGASSPFPAEPVEARKYFRVILE